MCMVVLVCVWNRKCVKCFQSQWGMLQVLTAHVLLTCFVAESVSQIVKHSEL